MYYRIVGVYKQNNGPGYNQYTHQVCNLCKYTKILKIENISYSMGTGSFSLD